jgi:hypothetical protein
MTQPPSLYSAFGLTIASDLPLVDLLPGSGAPDVIVSITGRTEGTPSDSWSVVASPGLASGTAPGAGRFVVREGREITLEPYADADARALRLAVVGPLLGVILTQRGHFVLHASTVAVNGQAVAFAGPSGRGKSTLAAAFTRAGHPLIADDMTLIHLSHDQPSPHPMVQPGFPRVKLWPDSAEALAHEVSTLPLIHPERTKRSVQTADVFHSSALPLKRCYLLEDGAEEKITPIDSGAATVLSLVRHTYQSSWMHESGASGANLLNCGALVRSGVVRKLYRRRSFETLPDVLRMIEEDIADETAD